MKTSTQTSAKSARPPQGTTRPAAGRTDAAFDTTLARLLALGPDGEPWISVEDDGAAALKARRRRARATVALHPGLVGRQVLICFAGAARTPVIVGVLVEPGAADGEALDRESSSSSSSTHAVDLVIDRRRIVLSAREEVVLRCGQASIVLRADGKAVIRGADVVSTAARTNRIRGGAVRIN